MFKILTNHVGSPRFESTHPGEMQQLVRLSKPILLHQSAILHDLFRRTKVMFKILTNHVGSPRFDRTHPGEMQQLVRLSKPILLHQSATCTTSSEERKLCSRSSRIMSDLQGLTELILVRCNNWFDYLSQSSCISLRLAPPLQKNESYVQDPHESCRISKV